MIHALQGLESRVLLSATFRGGVLTITGTEGDDVIRLSHPPALTPTRGRIFLIDADHSIILIDVNQTQYRFHTPAIRRIVIDAGGGDDRINFRRSPNVNCFVPDPIMLPDLECSPSIPTLIRGGEGNDSIVGSLAGDIILGGPGADTLLGNDGDDHLIGGDGDDYLYGGNGNDLLRGGAGDDALDGESGNDRSFGGRGNDFLDGVDGDDQLYGGIGDDQPKADSPADLLSGGDGDDTLLFPDNEESVPPFKVPADIEHLHAFGQGTVCV